MKNTALKITALSFAIALLMSGCSSDMPDETEAASLVTETGISETEAEEFPKIYNAEELYDVYPVKIIPPENNSKKISTETVTEAGLILYNDLGMEMGMFEASYPNITAAEYGEEVCEKTNAEFRRYRDECFERAQKTVNNHGLDENGVMLDSAREFYKTARDIFTVKFRGDSIGDNFLCVYFQYDPDLAGAAPEYIYPAPMMLDLNTGERVELEDIIEDKERFINALNEAAEQLVIMDDYQISADKYEETTENFNEYFDYDFFEIDYDKDGKRRLVSEDMLMKRAAVRDGCIGFYYTLYDFGVGRSDMEGYFAGIPLDEAKQYFTDYGKEIFAGYTSAKTEPAKVIEYKGERYFDTAHFISDIVDKENMTEGDREFVSLFEYVQNADYYQN